MTTNLTPVPADAVANTTIQALSRLTPAELQTAQQIAQKIDAHDSLEITAFAASAQQNVSAVTESLLGMTATKDADPGGALTDLMLELRTLDNAGIAARTESFLARLPVLGAWFDKVRHLILRYETINAKIERTAVALDNARNGLSRDIILMDQLFDRNAAYYRRLLVSIGAGEFKLQELREARAAACAQAAATQDPQLAQQAADLGNSIDQLEIRIHDLRLAGVLSTQTAAQLRVIQNGSRSLVTRIQTAIMTTIPLWRIQVCISIALLGQARAIKLQNLVSDTTNRLITANADKIRTLSNDAQTASQKGIVGLDTLRHANEQLIGTIEDSLHIQEEGRIKRQEAEHVLVDLQEQLRKRLESARLTAANRPSALEP